MADLDAATPPTYSWHPLREQMTEDPEGGYYAVDDIHACLTAQQQEIEKLLRRQATLQQMREQWNANVERFERAEAQVKFLESCLANKCADEGKALIDLHDAVSLLRKVRDADAKAMEGLESMGLGDDVDRSLMEEVARWLGAVDVPDKEEGE